MIKVSIIIPVYNVEKYLEQCVKSAVQQTMREIEIICINDGSTDNSLHILERMAEKDCRIRIINKPNSGYGHTMNIGLDLAVGKYLIFLESDDFILPELCEVLYNLCEKYNLEIAKTDYYEFKAKEDKICSRYMRASGDDTYHHVINPQSNKVIFRSAMYTWSCMYNREFINKYKIRHNETPGASYQDNGFWFQTLMYCKRIYLLKQAFYMYRQDNPDSSIYNKGKVHAFSNEYAFIREKIDNYKEENKILFLICAYFNINHNLTSLKRVNKKYTEELIRTIKKDIDEYKDRQVWKVKYLNEEFTKKILICMLQPYELKEKVWTYIDKASARQNIFDKYSTFILYGAGVYANRLLPVFEECKMWNKDIYCGITSVKEPGEKIGGIEIREIQELMQYKDSALIIVCAKKNSENYNQMCNNLKNWGVKNIIHSEELIVKDFWDEFLN